jgi:hypothetical protein
VHFGRIPTARRAWIKTGTKPPKPSPNIDKTSTILEPIRMCNPTCRRTAQTSHSKKTNVLPQHQHFIGTKPHVMRNFAFHREKTRFFLTTRLGISKRSKAAKACGTGFWKVPTVGSVLNINKKQTKQKGNNHKQNATITNKAQTSLGRRSVLYRVLPSTPDASLYRDPFQDSPIVG